MCLKNPSLNFDSVKNGRHNHSLQRLQNIEDSHLTSEQMLNYFNDIGFEKIIDSYNFKTIYDKLPIKDLNGNIEQNINKIYNECFKISLDNNKLVINDILNNPKLQNFHLSQTFHGLLKKSLDTQENNTLKLVASIHNKINAMSFNTKKIKMLRESFFNTDNSEITNKLK